VNNIQANVAYSLSSAVGTGSVSNSSANPAWYGSEIPKQTAPLDFDQRHKISINLDYLLGKGEGPKLGGIPFLQRTDINLLWNIASGTPYTQTEIYDEVSLAGVAKQPVGPLNSRNAPWTQNIDVKASKDFSSRGRTSRPTSGCSTCSTRRTRSRCSREPGRRTRRASSIRPPVRRRRARCRPSFGLPIDPAYSLAQQNQTLFANPRLIRLGLRMGF
jgi:hypothetical protein